MKTTKGSVNKNRSPRLTPRQRTVLKELREIASTFGLDFEAIATTDDDGSKTTRLELARDKIIRSQIVAWYTVTDYLLGSELSHHFFNLRKPLKYFRNSKRYRTFQREVLEDLGLRQKLRLVRTIWKRMPRRVFQTIEKLNTIRNSIAHSFFPEDRLGSKPLYKGKSVMAAEGLFLLSEDIRHVFDVIDKRAFRKYS